MCCINPTKKVIARLKIAGMPGLFERAAKELLISWNKLRVNGLRLEDKRRARNW